MFSSLLSGFSNRVGRDKIHMALTEAAGCPGDMRREKTIRLKTSNHHIFPEKQITIVQRKLFTEGLLQGRLEQRVSGLGDNLTSTQWYLNNLPERKQIEHAVTFRVETLSLIMSNAQPCPEVRPTLTQKQVGN